MLSPIGNLTKTIVTLVSLIPSSLYFSFDGKHFSFPIELIEHGLYECIIIDDTLPIPSEEIVVFNRTG